ncbi:MAG TPA: ABC transporter substrate-binding protein [Micromonospora sp.]|nr:ABC transporter substrate-binding protein [Micromonospora sp.]
MTTRRQTLRFLAALGAAPVLFGTAGCAGSSLDDKADAKPAGPIKIGLLLPQSGPYKALGDDMFRGWELYLSSRGGKLGNHPVSVVTADEAEGKQSALNAVKKLLDKDQVMVLAGTGTADTVETIKTLVTERKVPLVGSGGRPSTLSDVSYIWHTSWLSRETGQAIADHLRTTINGPVYVIGPDYQGGWDQIGGFVDTFTAGGGKLANDGGKPTWTPWPDTTNFLPYLNKITSSGAKAAYCFYAGAAAVEFVKQYAQAGLQGKVPLYGAGFLTEGAVLAPQGASADGVRTVLNYAPNLDNPANREFAAAYQQKHQAAPNIYSVTGYDTALVLDRAIAAVGANPTSESINAAIGKLGAIDSPRGQWRFGTNHSPIQPWYLREVRHDGRARANVVVQNLTTLGS